MNLIKKTLFLCAAVCGSAAFSSCEDTKSYSELLNEEEHAVNWFLAQHKVCLEIPADGNFETGDDAPYYKMDKEGLVYMQVLNKGEEVAQDATEEEKEAAEFEKGGRVYFRFMRMNIKMYFEYGSQSWEGNSQDMDNIFGSSYLIYGNNVLTSTTQYGEGLQVPLQYLHDKCQVNLVVKSPEGFQSETTQCNPYLFKIQYFKAIY